MYNNHPIGVWYSSSAQKWAIFNQNALSSMPIGADFNVLIPATDSAVFVHTATDDNIAGNATYINHSLTNGNPNAILFVTQNWNPSGGEIGVYNDHPIGVYYASLSQKWAIFNQDDAAMPNGAAFNILIPSVDTSFFVHTATAANIVANNTVIDHPLTNANPNAILFVTQNWNPGGGGGEINNHPIGVFYNDDEQKWGIFNQDTTSTMPLDAAFNVLIPPAGMDLFIHTATNIAVHYSYINHPLTNDNPNATVLVTQNWNPGGGEVGVYNNQSIGVFYSISMQQWAIFNQDRADMPDGAAFNIVVVFNKIYLPIILR